MTQSPYQQTPHCFAFSLLDRIDKGELTNTEAAWVAGTMLCVTFLLACDKPIADMRFVVAAELGP